MLTTPPGPGSAFDRPGALKAAARRLAALPQVPSPPVRNVRLESSWSRICCRAARGTATHDDQIYSLEHAAFCLGFLQVSKKLAAVLVPLYEDADGRIRVVLTLRSSKLTSHSGWWKDIFQVERITAGFVKCMLVQWCFGIRHNPAV